MDVNVIKQKFSRYQCNKLGESNTTNVLLRTCGNENLYFTNWPWSHYCHFGWSWFVFQIKVMSHCLPIFHVFCVWLWSINSHVAWLWSRASGITPYVCWTLRWNDAQVFLLWLLGFAASLSYNVTSTEIQSFCLVLNGKVCFVTCLSLCL